MAHLSLRERRERRQSRQKKGMTLNIVSLIDIFTVLVFFLLLNSTEVEMLSESKNVHLPESVAEAKPHENLVVMVSPDDILVQGQPVAKVKDVLNSQEATIPALRDALMKQLHPAIAGTAATAADDSGNPPRSLTVMGDREIPYRLLKKILATCTDVDYDHLSLAVLQKAGNINPVAAATEQGS